MKKLLMVIVAAILPLTLSVSFVRLSKGLPPFVSTSLILDTIRTYDPPNYLHKFFVSVLDDSEVSGGTVDSVWDFDQPAFIDWLVDHDFTLRSARNGSLPDVFYILFLFPIDLILDVGYTVKFMYNFYFITTTYR